MTPLKSAVAAITLCLSVTPAAAQLFWQPPDFSGAPYAGLEPGAGEPLPGATPAEQRAALIWNLRAGLNVAALQCQFEPMLHTLSNYNAILNDHSAELAVSFTALSNYFKRTHKTAKAGQTALDRFGTKTYIGWSTVRAQLGFCLAAGQVGRVALFTRRGSFGIVAEQRLRELRNSLIPQGEQYFRFPQGQARFLLPRLENACWDKKDRYRQNCGLV